MTHKTSDPDWLYSYEENLGIICGAANLLAAAKSFAETTAEASVTPLRCLHLDTAGYKVVLLPMRTA